jgi:protein transport protein SEC13
MLAAGSSDGTVSLLTYRDDGTWDDNVKITAHAIGVNAVAWAPATYAGALLAAAGSNTNGGPDITSDIPEPKLASGGCDNLIKLWVLRKETMTFENIETLEAHEDWVRDVSFASNVGIPSQYLASCSQDKTVYIWTQSNQSQPFEKKKMHTFPEVAWRVSWSLAGDILAVSSGDNKVTLWRETLQGDWECVSTLEE